MECPNDINGMIDAAKFADLALLLIDGSYGFEMVSSCYLYWLFLFSPCQNIHEGILSLHFTCLLEFLHC